MSDIVVTSSTQLITSTVVDQSINVDPATLTAIVVNSPESGVSVTNAGPQGPSSTPGVDGHDGIDGAKGDKGDPGNTGITEDDTLPSAPTDTDPKLWFDTSTGKLYAYYDGYWVEIPGSPGPAGSGSDIPDSRLLPENGAFTEGPTTWEFVGTSSGVVNDPITGSWQPLVVPTGQQTEVQYPFIETGSGSIVTLRYDSGIIASVDIFDTTTDPSPRIETVSRSISSGGGGATIYTYDLGATYPGNFLQIFAVVPVGSTLVEASIA